MCDPIAHIAVLWDFDWSLINENSDFYVMRKLYGKEKYDQQIYKELKAEAKEVGVTVFTDIMDQFAWPKLFNDFKLNKQSFAKHLCDIPIFDENLKIIRTLGNKKYANMTTQFVISDANTVLIESVLAHHNIFPDIISSQQIYTNPGWYDEKSGLLRCRRYHSKENPHGSLLNCSLNMCKGKILNEEIMKDLATKTKIDSLMRIYIGDGSGDYCPITKLNQNDFAFVRKGFSLEKRIDDKVKCTVMKWEDGEQLLDCFKKALPF